ncbi:hypothetical protein [Streptomyces glaucescens]|uniref:Secreted protein n=1 Tax=Streptomyces glaucescens TaxID=1907 RepID=A0A089X6N3_STRGA|nr:hypothetical protein [Streptomyces glaucescens]AIR99567.1 hypothetical protein SGLAU_18025 [Streptomyces glaucescens]
MTGSDLEAFLEMTGNAVTARIRNADASDSVTTDDAVSIVLGVDTADGTHLEFIRPVDEVGPGTSWEHTWTIQGPVRHADANVRDGSGSVLATASADV